LKNHPPGLSAPSAWVLRHQHLIKPAGRVLDLACGSGRHFRWLAQQGFAVTGVDRDAAALAGLQGLGETLLADVETGPWPLAGRQFDAVVVTNYLWRPLFPLLMGLLDVGAVLIYETFASGHETVGRPSRPDFLLRPGELLQAFGALRVVAFEDGFEAGVDQAMPRFVQRLVGVNESRASTGPQRYELASARAPGGGAVSGR
jgi:SAM-dependent methyltransferase